MFGVDSLFFLANKSNKTVENFAQGDQS